MAGKHRAPEQPEPADDRVLVSRQALLDAVPCECDEAWTDRGLTAPQCRHHDLRDVLEEEEAAQ